MNIRSALRSPQVSAHGPALQAVLEQTSLAHLQRHKAQQPVLTGRDIHWSRRLHERGDGDSWQRTQAHSDLSKCQFPLQPPDLYSEGFPACSQSSPVASEDLLKSCLLLLWTTVTAFTSSKQSNSCSCWDSWKLGTGHNQAVPSALQNAGHTSIKIIYIKCLGSSLILERGNCLGHTFSQSCWVWVQEFGIS